MKPQAPGTAAGEGVSYGDRWNAAHGTPGQPLPEDEARRRHKSRQRYGVFIGGHEHPRIAIDVHLEAGLVQVFFLDAECRWTMKYVFVADGDGLWLEQVHLREWLADGRVRFESTTFRPDGQVYAERGIDRDATKEVARGRFDPDSLTFLREPVPTFGDYASIVRGERGPEVPARPPTRSAGRSSGRSAGRSSGRASGRASGRSFGRTSGRTSGRTPDQAPDVPDRAPDAPDRAPGEVNGSPGGPSKESPGAPSKRSTRGLSRRAPEPVVEQTVVQPVRDR